jgi:hypothetical protein
MNQHTAFLLLAVLLAAGIQISIGYLPARKLTDSFFIRCTLVTSFLWMIVGMSRSNLLSFVILAFTILAWWNFKRGQGKTAKLFLATSSALGVTFGVVGQDLLQRSLLLPPSWTPLTFIGTYLLGAVLTTTAMILLLGHARTAGEAPASMFVAWIKGGLMAQGLQLAFVSYAFVAVTTGGPEMDAWRASFLPGGNSFMVLVGRMALGLILPAGILIALLHAATKETAYQPKVRMLGVFAGIVATGVLFAFRVGF